MGTNWLLGRDLGWGRIDDPINKSIWNGIAVQVWAGIREQTWGQIADKIWEELSDN